MSTNLYSIIPQDDIEMLRIVQSEKIPATFWPNTDKGQPSFELELTRDELLLLKLKIPFTHRLISRSRMQA